MQQAFQPVWHARYNGSFSKCIADNSIKARYKGTRYKGTLGQGGGATATPKRQGDTKSIECWDEGVPVSRKSLESKIN